MLALYTGSIPITTERHSMGKGDLRSRRGKIYNGSHGKKRPGRAKKAAAPVTRTNAGPARSSSKPR